MTILARGDEAVSFQLGQFGRVLTAVCAEVGVETAVYMATLSVYRRTNNYE